MKNKLVRGYSVDAIHQNVEILLDDGVDEITAISIAISYARGLFKRDHPSSTMFPKHLIPSLAIKSYRENKGGVVDADTEEES